jgi:ABC-type dipeptide/oligopeptide/nickel transport system permease component
MHGALGRIGATITVLMVAMVVLFLALRAMPGDPARIRLQERARVGTAALVETRRQMDLDAPIVVQFGHWLAGLFRGDLGRSFRTDRPVIEDIGRRLPWSAAIGIPGLGSACLLGFVVGFLVASRPGGLTDLASRGLSVMTQALPAFGVATLLLWILAGEWHLIRPFSGSVVEKLILPILIVALFSTASIARVVAVTFCEVEHATYFKAMMMKGLTRRSVASSRRQTGHSGDAGDHCPRAWLGYRRDDGRGDHLRGSRPVGHGARWDCASRLSRPSRLRAGRGSVDGWGTIDGPSDCQMS